MAENTEKDLQILDIAEDWVHQKEGKRKCICIAMEIVDEDKTTATAVSGEFVSGNKNDLERMLGRCTIDDLEKAE